MLKHVKEGIKNNMTCKFTIKSRIGLEPSIAALNQSIQPMDLQIPHKHCKETTNKAPIPQGRSEKISMLYYYIFTSINKKKYGMK